MPMICSNYNKYREISIVPVTVLIKFWFILSMCTCLRSLITVTQYSIMYMYLFVYTLVTLSQYNIISISVQCFILHAIVLDIIGMRINVFVFFSLVK